VTTVFPIIPASAKPIWLLAAICVVLSIILVALSYTAYSARNSRFEVDHGQLRLVGDFWARSIPIQSLLLERAAILDLEKSLDYAPHRRTLGTGLPGYARYWPPGIRIGLVPSPQWREVVGLSDPSRLGRLHPDIVGLFIAS